jgi:hypothetical protein
VALHPSFIVYADIVQTEALYIVFVLLTFLSVERMQTGQSFAEAAMLGLMAALATLTRAVFFSFFPLLLIVVALLGRTRSIAAKAMFAFAVWCLMLLPWTMRNYEVHGTFVPISSWGGISLLLGNNPYSNGTWSGKPGFQEWFAAEASVRGVDLERSTEIERSEVGRKLAFEFISHEPIAALKLTVRKLYMHWVYPISNSDSNAKLQVVCVAADMLLYIFAGMGIIALQSWKKALPIMTAILFFTAMQGILHCEARYRLPIMPFVAMLAGVGASVLIDTRTLKEFFNISRRKYLALSWVGIVVCVYAFTAWQFLSGTI